MTIFENTKADKRYTVTLEFCGHPTALPVVRFCGNWVGSASTEQAAWELATEHNGKRIGVT